LRQRLLRTGKLPATPVEPIQTFELRLRFVQHVRFGLYLVRFLLLIKLRFVRPRILL
jgi:hypothetical protein